MGNARRERDRPFFAAGNESNDMEIDDAMEIHRQHAVVPQPFMCSQAPRSPCPSSEFRSMNALPLSVPSPSSPPPEFGSAVPPPPPCPFPYSALGPDRSLLPPHPIDHAVACLQGM